MSGLKMVAVTCDRCDGNGAEPYSDGGDRCLNCHGRRTEHVSAERTIPCDACGDTGYDPDDPPTEDFQGQPCPTCRGMRHPASRRTVPTAGAQSEPTQRQEQEPTDG